MSVSDGDFAVPNTLSVILATKCTDAFVLPTPESTPHRPLLLTLVVRIAFQLPDPICRQIVTVTLAVAGVKVPCSMTEALGAAVAGPSIVRTGTTDRVIADVSTVLTRFLAETFKTCVPSVALSQAKTNEPSTPDLFVARTVHTLFTCSLNVTGTFLSLGSSAPVIEYAPGAMRFAGHTTSVSERKGVTDGFGVAVGVGVAVFVGVGVGLEPEFGGLTNDVLDLMVRR